VILGQNRKLHCLRSADATISVSTAGIRANAAMQQSVRRMGPVTISPDSSPGPDASIWLGRAQPVIAVRRERDGRPGQRRIGGRTGLAIDDEGNIGAAQAEIGKGTVVEGAELGKGSLAAAKLGATKAGSACSRSTRSDA